jgi:hypothetical protein
VTRPTAEHEKDFVVHNEVQRPSEHTRRSIIRDQYILFSRGGSISRALAPFGIDKKPKTPDRREGSVYNQTHEECLGRVALRNVRSFGVFASGSRM